MKKMISALLAMAMLMSITGCAPAEEPNGSDVALPQAPEGAISTREGKSILAVTDYELVFSQGAEGYQLEVVSKADGSVMFCQNAMAAIRVRGEGAEDYSEEIFRCAYDEIARKPYGYLLSATVQTASGSQFLVRDAYYVVNDRVFGLERQVEVLEANAADAGFASMVSLVNRDGSASYSDFEYFIPAILYKDASNVVGGSIASDLDVDRVYVKETRTGLPMVLVQNSRDDYGLALMHLEPQISVGGNIGSGAKGEVNDDLQYGAVGIEIRSGVGTGFIYPCMEGPNTYDAGRDNVGRYHSVTQGNSHTYKLGLIPTGADTYTDAMTDTYMAAFGAERRDIADIDMQTIYDQHIEIFQGEYREYTYEGEVVAAGLPWSLSLPNGVKTEGFSFQMGFVGQQLPLGYQLYRYGLDNGDATAVSQGEAIVDMWASEKIQSDYFPAVWFDPKDAPEGGSIREYPSFLRCMVDGMEGMLDACRIAKAYGREQEQWHSAVIKFGCNLMAVQNEDGSFYRAYRRDGTVETDTSNPAFQGTSKLNTPIAVRFLAKMYEYTGDEDFRTAALKAAQYSYEELYVNLGKYVGGTPDNPNTVDKEAAMYALYAFSAAYQLSGEEKYLDAAKHAAVSTMSWTYVYDFVVPSSNSMWAAMNPFRDGGVIGFSLIATGHSGADNCSAFSFYELYKLYVLTGDSFFLDSALLLENNTKLSTDHDGALGFKYRAMMPEAANVADFSFTSVGTWLPWSGIANIDPMIQLQEAFGQMDISDITADREALKEMLEDYGCGGKPLTR